MALRERKTQREVVAGHATKNGPASMANVAQTFVSDSPTLGLCPRAEVWKLTNMIARARVGTARKT